MRSQETNELEKEKYNKKNLNKNVFISKDINKRKIVMIHDIRFRGKRKIAWKEVEQYLKQYVGKCYEIVETAKKIYIGKDLADEYTNSQYTQMIVRHSHDGKRYLYDLINIKKETGKPL